MTMHIKNGENIVIKITIFVKHTECMFHEC